MLDLVMEEVAMVTPTYPVAWYFFLSLVRQQSKVEIPKWIAELSLTFTALATPPLLQLMHTFPLTRSHKHA